MYKFNTDIHTQVKIQAMCIESARTQLKQPHDLIDGISRGVPYESALRGFQCFSSTRL